MAAFADLQTHHWQPALRSATRTVRCAGLHRPPRDFISMAIDFRRCQTRVSGTPAFTTRRLRSHPDSAEDVTGSVAVALTDKDGANAAETAHHPPRQRLLGSGVRNRGPPKLDISVEKFRYSFWRHDYFFNLRYEGSASRLISLGGALVRPIPK
jgi:hypothetical protein